MEHFKKIFIPARAASEKEVRDHLICDFCGSRVKDSRGEVENVTLQFEKGCYWPEGGYGVRTIFDCCPQCWESKIAPALQALTQYKVSGRREEWDY